MAPRADLLGEILARKAEEVAGLASAKARAELEARARDLPPARGFLEAIARDSKDGVGNAVVAEIKRASPSGGELRGGEGFSPCDIARDFEAHGASALSVLTDAEYFHGSARDLAEARGGCALPVLRKDFMVDRYQILESRCMGADAVLLIAAALADSRLEEFAGLAGELGLDVLVEIHDAEDLERVLGLSPDLYRLLGVNNRNLRTLETDLQTTLALRTALPAHCVVMSESGIRTREDVLLLKRHNVHAFLVGETLMRAARPGEKLQELFAPPR